LSRPPTDDEMDAEIQHMATKRQQLEDENTRLQAEIEVASQSLEELKTKLREKIYETRLLTVREEIREDVRAALRTAEEARSDVQAYLAEKLGSLRDVTDEQLTSELPEEEQKQLAGAESNVTRLKESVLSPEDIRIMGIEDICWVLLNRNEFLFNH